ncbi:MAG: hypothetical protein IKM55_00855 [Bacilli bacterium]|nr:hypothetical protein [Bacillota bacterium]MBR6820755.1 hypothetical protein [Bacilli bacterium]
MFDRLFGTIMHNAGNAIGNAIGESVGDVIEGATQGITNEMNAKNQARQNELQAQVQAQRTQLQMQNQAQADAMQREIDQANVNHELAIKEQRMVSELPSHCPHCNAPTAKSINCEFCGCKIVE